VRIKVDDFAAAVKELQTAQLITGHRDGRLIAPAPGAGTDQMIRLLVQKNIPIYEITRAEESLEDFYLSLMKEQKSSS
jgi:hypothetical protein